METFAQRITRLRRQRKLTQKQIAEVLGIPLSTYKEWEYGRRIQGEEVYARLAEVLEVNLKTLLTGAKSSGQEEVLEMLDGAIDQLKELKATLMSL
jgi:transcriptional regulator with XRE-family HTH domain